MPERQRYYNPMMQYVEETRPKPNEGYQDRIKQSQKVNAIAQVLNLVTQGAAASKGGTVLPTNDKVTPFAMSEFQKMREQEIAQGEHDRKYGLQALTKELDYGVKLEDRDDAWKKIQAQQEFQRGENQKYKATPDQQLEFNIARGLADSGNREELEKIRHQQNLERDRLRHESTIREIRERANNPSSSRNEKYILTIPDADKKYEFTTENVKDIFSVMMNDPEILESIKEDNIAVFYEFKYNGKVPPEGFISTKIREHWPKLKSTIDGTLYSGTSKQSQQAVGTGQPPNQYQSTTGSGMLARPAQPEKKQDEGSPLDKIFNDKQKRDPVFTENYNKVINQIMTAFDAPDYSYSQKIQLIEAAFKSIGMNDDQVSQMKNLLLR